LQRQLALVPLSQASAGAFYVCAMWTPRSPMIRYGLWNAARGALPKVPLSRACISLPILNAT
jgi:hypothetical protein